MIQSKSWSSFTRRITINATPQQVYNAWTSQQGLERWFLRKAEFTDKNGKRRESSDTIQAGDNYHWLWFGYSDDAFEKRKVISNNGSDELQFTFSGDCLVTVKVYLENKQTICELLQENIPDDNDPTTNLHIGCSNGWTFYLANLKSILEGGIDLRNKDEKISHVVNA